MLASHRVSCFVPRVCTMVPRYFSAAASTEAESVSDAPMIVEARKRNIPQSPWKMRFLVKLIRNAWVPDAMAQLKFSPKHRAVDVGHMVKRATVLAQLNYDAIPEQLSVKEVYVTKGMSRKKIRIMGRGRHGVGYQRWTHVTLRLEVIDFAARIRNAESQSQKSKWQKREALVEELKLNPREKMTPAKPRRV